MPPYPIDSLGDRPSVESSSAATESAGGPASPGGHGPTGSRLAVVMATVLTVVQLVVVIAFAWPAARSEPHDVPIVVAGTSQMAGPVKEHLQKTEPGAFDIAVKSDEKAARDAILDRDAYAAIVADPKGPKVLISSAASGAVAAAFTHVAGEIEKRSGKPVTLEDVRPAPKKDARGAAFASSMLPLVLTGMIGGILVALKLPGRRERLLAATAFAAFAGLCTTAVVHGWIGAFDGNYLAEASIVSLIVFTISITIAGLGTALGHAGLGLGVITVLLLGNPLSGVASAPEMLPQPWGAFGQLLPPGAGASLLRSVTFFDGAASAGPLITLLTWATCGLALLFFGGSRRAKAGRP
ncbi:ABC transporter permease [Streptomyces actinomycinicus]|uniref:ABC transporter permease n=1 Tax=Streptomyces actinomycinicus TaxID=1695166 RepID=A0A937EIJ1_9ACTN|nr:ABC transporter permease [Streptomyces actinomycinicus]MBL1083481.1 ABC transporter permease [Streptomyces actinomycinicus]